MFEKASRLKLRFKVANGTVSAEDLWDLPLTQLDTLAKALRKQVAESEDSFISENTGGAERARTELRFEIVKHVISTLIAEKDRKAENAKKAARKAQLLEVLERKQGDALAAMSTEDIMKELATL